MQLRNDTVACRMSSFLTIFCCCGRSEARLDDDSDETSRLIPPDLEPTQSPTVTFTDHQRIQERLVTIVRAKERKMVNVTSEVPFNLHNRVVASHPSLSRSGSLSAVRRDPEPPSYDAREPLTVQLRSPPSALGSQNNSSHSNSRSASLTRDPSEAEPPNPRLNLRLVTSVNSTASQRVGRPRHRAFGSPTSAEQAETRSLEGDPAKPSVSASNALMTPSPPPLDEICWSWGDT